MHISSLPSPYGIGTMGKDAYEFVDFLKLAGQSYWQILPLCPTSFGDSPYQSFSSYAGNPYFIDLDKLEEQGLLKKEEYDTVFWGEEPTGIEYGILYENRYPVLRKVVPRFKESLPKDFNVFLEQNKHWLSDYSLYMTIKWLHQDRCWTEWELPYRFREPAALEDIRSNYKEEIFFWNMIQYLFFQQWGKLKAYANENGIEIIGDIPIYTAMDSADVWANTAQFYLNDALQPIEVSGVPPDAFTADGQLWGNPLFRWEVMEQDGFAWWINRLAHVTSIYDVTRIDHFRGFDSYYAIPAEELTARHGTWRQGPGIKFFDTVKEKLPQAKFIAEDLGYLTPSVLKLVKDTGYPGMKILQFAFDSREDSDYLPHNYTSHSVTYTGTHDNDTILGWFNNSSPADTQFAIDYLRLTTEEGYHWGMMNSAWGSASDWVIVTMQDLLGLGSWARMNTPSTIGDNWKWRSLPGDFSKELSEKIYKQIHTYRRLPSR